MRRVPTGYPASLCGCVLPYCREAIENGEKLGIGLAWSAQGEEIWFTADEQGTDMALHAITPAGRHRVVCPAPVRLLLHDISRDGRVLISRQAIHHTAFALGPSQSRERDLSYLDHWIVLGLSNDGKTALLVEQGGDEQLTGALYLRKTDGSRPDRLGDWTSASLSGDANRVVGIQPGPPERLLVQPTGPGQPTPLEKGLIQKYQGGTQWFPDGQSVLFSASQPNRGLRLYAHKVDGGPPRAVTEEGVDQSYFAIKPDCTMVAAVNSEHQIVLYPLGGGDPLPMPGLAEGDLPVQWTSDGRYLYVRRRSGLPLIIERYNLAEGRKEHWKEIKPSDPAGLLDIFTLSLTPDGESYAYTSFRIMSDLFAIEGLKLSQADICRRIRLTGTSSAELSYCIEADPRGTSHLRPYDLQPHSKYRWARGETRDPRTRCPRRMSS